MSEPRRYRAPRHHGGFLSDPPLAEAGGLAAGNRAALGHSDLSLFGRPLQELRRSAAAEVLAAARSYMNEAGEPLPDLPGNGLLLSGHQPELFHPGVWVKNFAMARLAQTHGLTAVNLVIDNDALKIASLAFPAPAGERSPRPHPVPVPFDRWTGEIPFEERTVLDEELFASFPTRARPACEGWGFEPMLPAFWEDVRQQKRRTALIGERFAAARRTWERRWGCHNLEVPLSRLCRGESFARFVTAVLAELPRFHRDYNESLQAYRRRHGLRSKHHPVPDLATDGDWLEAPFWVWRAGATRRGRLFVRQGDRRFEIKADSTGEPLAAVNHPDGDVAATEWLALEAAGLKVRTRALTTTIFARVFLSDLFVHGIGGGTYDELTDEIIRRFYRLEPPGFLVLSGTLLLPLPASGTTDADRRHLGRTLRDLYWNPQRYLGDRDVGGRERELVARKTMLIAEEPTDPAGKRRRFEALRQLTEALRPLVTADGHVIEERLTDAERTLQVDAVRQRRDYSFCLYPETSLRAGFEQLLAGT